MGYMNKEYWDNFYLKTENLSQPSTFAIDILEKVNLSNSILIDLGCGTGKDTFYFLRNNVNAIGIDGSKEVIKNNLKKMDNNSNELHFYCLDLSDSEEVKKFFSEFNRLATEENSTLVFYNRFFMHSITEEVEDIVLNNINNIITSPCKVICEFRTKEDSELDKVYNNHYRRYIDTDKFIRKILNLEFKLLSFKKGRGYSKYEDEDPFLARIIFENNKEV